MADAADRARTDWDALNLRQQTYLGVIFDADQTAEASQPRWGPRPPAAEWRRLTFAIEHVAADPTDIQQQLKAAGIHDPGAGSTLAALKRRELITVHHSTVLLPIFGLVPAVKVQMTPRGRAAVRAARHITLPRQVAGLHSRWMFETLARIYRAGPGGLNYHERVDGPRHLWPPTWEAILNVRNRRVPLAEDYAADPATGEEAAVSRPGRGTEQRVRLTWAGKRHYVAHFACYRDLYPDLDWAPEPEADGHPVHDGLTAHRARRPRHLVGQRALECLAELVRYDLMNDADLDRTQARTYAWVGRHLDLLGEDAGGFVLPRTYVSATADRTKALAELADYPTTPLVEQHVLPYSTHRHLPALVTLTDAGSEHYCAYVAEYRHTHLDLDLPDPAPKRCALRLWLRPRRGLLFALYRTRAWGERI